MMLHVATSPEVGAIDRDARRMLVLRSVDRIRIVLRLDPAGEGLGAPVRLNALEFVDALQARSRSVARCTAGRPAYDPDDTH